LEHLSRRTSGRPDVLVCVTNRSRMGARTIADALALYAGLNGALPPRVDLVLNQFEEGEPLASEMAAMAAGESARFTAVYTLPRDSEVARFESEGKSLLQLSLASPAAAALGGWEIGA
jgi:CO dehydrogenase nickel-insertion accessory protein CooC1